MTQNNNIGKGLFTCNLPTLRLLPFKIYIMAILKSKTTKYEFSLDEMKKLIAEDMKVPVEAIHVNYVIEEVGGDVLDRYPGIKTVTKIEVIVDETKINLES